MIEQLPFQVEEGGLIPTSPLNYYLKQEKITTLNTKIDPTKIWVHQTDVGSITNLQKKMSKAVWRPAPGRKLAFCIMHNENLLGLAFLASPVINLQARDQYLKLNLNSSLKGKELRNYADLSICVSAQPFGWHWNGGKLIALLATTFEPYWKERYGDDLKGIITTSLWGKSSQYNRVYKFLGYTKGYGHQHISDEEYNNMLNWMKENNIEIPSSKFGAGSNPRMRRIMAYYKANNIKNKTLKHNQIRGIYYSSKSENNIQEVINYWYNRWGLPRYLKTKNLIPPYTDGLSLTGNH